MKRPNWRHYFKILFEFVVTVLVVALTSPLLLLLAFAVYLKMGSPIFFTQERVGKDNRIFKILKFRTMLEPSVELKSDADRLTSFGRLLRSTSLDEIPELWNVLRGEMSLVGPRPLLVPYLEHYSAEQARRHEVRPGLTGWAQINGRNAISWQEKFKLDVWYVDNQSFWFDIKIIALTVMKILRRDGISADGEATMPFFTGNGTTSNDEARNTDLNKT